MLVLSNFFFCHNVFKSRLLQRRQKASICGEGLMDLDRADSIILKHMLEHLLAILSGHLIILQCIDGDSLGDRDEDCL